jgi:hypothetical protein
MAKVICIFTRKKWVRPKPHQVTAQSLRLDVRRAENKLDDAERLLAPLKRKGF